MQAILGSGGVVGNELAKALKKYTDRIRLVSRNPKPVNEDDELLAVDLIRAEDAHKAVQGVEVAYLTVGLPYSTEIWQRDWPVLMRNVIEACKENGTKLVFFDNTYMYHPKYIHRMNERTPVRTLCKKSRVRYRLARMILNEINIGTMDAIIARSGDFYGPSIKDKSMLTEMVFNRLAEGKKAMWLGSKRYEHSFTYVPDAAKATAMLGNTKDAYNQVWHLPTAPKPLTGKGWIKLIAKEMNVKPKYRVISKFQVWLAGFSVPVMKEMLEMMYQYKGHYSVNSRKFEERFNFRPMPYTEGVRIVIKTDYSHMLEDKAAE